MAPRSPIELAIQQQLTERGTCSLGELALLLPGYSWAQVFTTVDRMSRHGALTLRRPDAFRYLLALTPRHAVATPHTHAPMH